MKKQFEISKQRIQELITKYGSPLYIYDETVLRKRCNEMMQLVSYQHFRPNYSAKANTNIELLKIIKSEGLSVDAMSPGEIVLEQAAGFQSDEILYISNNVSEEEMQFAVEHQVTVSVDSLSQLETFGGQHPGKRVAVRLNPGIGAGHNKKVITGGKSKFGIEMSEISNIKRIAEKYQLQIVGVNQHIGSLFLDGKEYRKACETIFIAAKQFSDLEFVDLGGGFGVPYNGEVRLDLEELSAQLDQLIHDFIAAYDNKSIEIKIEPGRYIVAECGILAGVVNSVKTNYGEKYIGTDIGFNVLMRPVLYDSFHNIRVYNEAKEQEKVTVVGNICETGDILAKDRLLPCMTKGDILTIETVGAYGYSMCSNYNSRLRPAEVLIQGNGQDRLIRRRDTLEDLLRQM
ncbi:MAG: diaminopimelate decarboxylase [Mobilitalea sp.]